jgi:hypothetical protein
MHIHKMPIMSIPKKCEIVEFGDHIRQEVVDCDHSPVFVPANTTVEANEYSWDPQITVCVVTARRRSQANESVLNRDG